MTNASSEIFGVISLMARFCRPEEVHCIHVTNREVKHRKKRYAVGLRVMGKGNKRKKPHTGCNLMPWTTKHKATLLLKEGVQPFLSAGKGIPSHTKTTALVLV